MKEKKDLIVLRHSAAHLLAHAVTEIFPGTLLTIGPATEEGFFFDFLPTKSFKEKDLVDIEMRMHQLSKDNLSITHEHILKEEARAIFKNNKFKLELIDGIEGGMVGVSRQGDFYDLCKGGHVESTSEITHFKLLSISGSYWRGDRNGIALQRITGTAFFTQEELEQFEQQKELVLQFDHRRIGKQQDLFSFSEEGVGFPFYHPKGMRIINCLKAYMRILYIEYNYEEVQTPTMLKDDLWKRSGHYEFYKENMYFSCIDDENYALKPMNCPGAMLIYKTRPRSYKELPLRFAEFGHVHRHELSGVSHGLFRARAFTQDDAHIFCSIDQIESEIITIIELIQRMVKRFGFERYFFALSTKPEKSMGSDLVWEKAINALKNALEYKNISYTIKEGDGAFYGPKIDFALEDSLGRLWQCATTQLDFFQPENFDLSFINSSGEKERPVIIHRAIYGSLERFLGILLEHYKGRLPFFIASIQIKVLTITDAQKPYALNIVNALIDHGFRVEMHQESDPINAQIKEAQQAQIPLMLVIGKKEVEHNTLTIRDLVGKQEFGLSLFDVIKKAEELNKE